MEHCFYVNNLFHAFHSMSVDVPSISNPMEVENCVSYYNLNWTDTTQCIPVSYTVVLTNTSSGEMHSSTTDVTSYNFTELTSNTNYTVCITGRNRVGLSDAMMEFKTPHSAGKFILYINNHVIVGWC